MEWDSVGKPKDRVDGRPCDGLIKSIPPRAAPCMSVPGCQYGEVVEDRETNNICSKQRPFMMTTATLTKV
ncbi:jg14697 [Pararge aegeria aegeria]|uniref:Jg14697 protein n=1 Tax=Pararge aegeria aegeria TaxID=348720 RepID=A0A8S4SKK8_9NEOP|nr:jg14697 [Pararge aegeria aegeria]